MGSTRMSRLGLLALVAVLSLWAVCAAPPIVLEGGPETISSQQQRSSSDVRLYRDVVQDVKDGQGYYTAVAQLHRERGYPLQPFFVVRPPLLAEVTAALGTRAMTALAWLAALAAIGLWYRALANRTVAERVAATGLLALGSASLLLSSTGIAIHEVWAGLLLSCSLALFPRWQLMLPWLAAALFLRELSLAFALLLLAYLILQRNRQGILACMALILLFGAYMAWHAGMVASIAETGDLSTQGWLGLRGPGGMLDHLRTLSFLQLFPRPVAAFLLFLPLLGWSSLDEPHGSFCLLWFGGFTVLLTVFARADNLFWSAVILPVYLAGFALVPAFFASLIRWPDPAPATTG